MTYTFSKDDVQIGLFTEDGAHLRSTKGINFPYIFQEKEIFDKIPTVSISNFREMDGGPYPSSSSGPIHTVANTTTWVKGRHTFKAGLSVEYSGEDDFDQINVSAIPGGTNNQNGRFEFLDARTGGTGTGIANVALGLYSNYAELGQRNFTQWRALATDIFVQDSWKPTSALTIEGGFRYVYWPPWYSTTNNISNFDPRFYDQVNEAVMSGATGRRISGPRYNGVLLPGDGFEGDAASSALANDPAILALFRGEPRGFSETHANVFEPRLGASYALGDKTVIRASGGIFHNRVTLNDSTLLGGNPPFQPMVSISNGSADNPAGVGGSSEDLPLGINGQDPVFKHPTSYLMAVGVQREVPLGFVVDVTYVHRKGLYLQRERQINQLEAGTLQRNPGVNIAALRPYTGFGAIRISENSARSVYNSLQISADRRYSNGLKVGFAYTLGKSEDNGSDKRNIVWNTYDDTGLLGRVAVRPPSRVELLLHLRSAVLPRPEPGPDGQPARRLADLGRHVLPHRHAVLHRQQQHRHRGRRRRRQRPAVEPRGRRQTRARTSSSPTPRAMATSGSTPRRSRHRRPARSATRRATCSTTRANSSGTWRSSRTSRWVARAACSSAPRRSTSSTTRTGTTSRPARCRAAWALRSRATRTSAA